MFRVRLFGFLLALAIGICCTPVMSVALYAAVAESVEVATDAQAESTPASSRDSLFDFFDLSTWKTETSKSWAWLLIASFLAGILISFTPCVYPMIPVTAAIMQNYAQGSLFRTIIRALFYIMGIAVVYASFGYFSASSSVIFGSWMASPWMIGFIVLFYLYCAGAMFDLYDIYIPTFLSQQRGFSSNGSLFSIFLYGLLTGTFASPCVTPGLALILGIVNQLRNPLLGFSMLFLFAIGMSFLLVLVSLSTNLAHRLPHAGTWMLEIKKIFGFLLLAVTLLFVQPFLIPLHKSIAELALLVMIILFYGYQLQQKIAFSSARSGASEVPVPPVHMPLYYMFVSMYTIFIVASSIRVYYLLIHLFAR